MHQDFRRFVRRGGHGEYVIRWANDRNLSRKSHTPQQERLRQDFQERLAAIAEENARMLLSALSVDGDMPYSEADLLPALPVIEDVLQEWESRLGEIHTHHRDDPDSIPSLRMQMEDRTAASFAGLINQLRQEALGIEHYVWVTAGDEKVRPSHATLEGVICRWDDPPNGYHPGQEANCRCVAKPAAGDMALGSFMSIGDITGNLTLPDLSRALQRLAARTPAGLAILAALESADELNRLADILRHTRVKDISRRLGLDMQSIEGLLAAGAYGLVYETVLTGFLHDIPKTAEAARIAGQAAALYELLEPGTILDVQGGVREAQIALAHIVGRAWQAHEQGRLGLTADEWAEGWIEVFPELTGDERRLGELPGFTGAQQDAFILADPVLNDGLPAHTGHTPEGDPAAPVISTPISAEEYAQILERARNEPGQASGAGQKVGTDWLREGVRTGVMPIPESVAERLAGRQFGSFDGYRRAFWKAVAEEPELLGQFGSFNQKRIRAGLAPRAPVSSHVGKRNRWELDHIEPLWADSALYDAENLQIMTPEAHIEKTREDMREYHQ